MGWEALLECRNGSGVPPGEMGVPGRVERDGRGQEDFQENLEGSGGPPGEPGGVGWVGRKWETLRMSGRGREAIQKGHKRPGGTPGVTGAVGTDGRGCKALPECQEESGSLPRGPGGVRSLFWIARKG